jgi:hypothetical protein
MSERSRYDARPHAAPPRRWPEERSDRHDLELKKLVFLAPGEQRRVRLRITSFSDETETEVLLWLTDVVSKKVVFSPREVVPERCAFSADGALVYLQVKDGEPIEAYMAADGRPADEAPLPRRRDELVFLTELMMRAGADHARVADDFLARLLDD